MLALTELSEPSILDEEVEMLFELATVTPIAASILDDDSDRLSEDVPLVAILAFTELSELSTLDDEVETASELAFIVSSPASTLEDELDKLRLDS